MAVAAARARDAREDVEDAHYAEQSAQAQEGEGGHILAARVGCLEEQHGQVAVGHARGRAHTSWNRATSHSTAPLHVPARAYAETGDGGVEVSWHTSRMVRTACC